MISGAAQAGSAGAPAAMPVQIGQVWQLTAQPTPGETVTAALRVERELLPVMPDAHTFALTLPGAGGDLYFSPSERGLVLSVVYSETRTYRCFGLWPVGARQVRGVLLSGSVAQTNDRMTRAQRGSDYSFQALMAGLRRVGAGSCTITLR